VNSFSKKIPLGRTGLSVSRLGIGSAYGVSPKACRMAFDAGVNYFFWGSVRTPGMALAIRDISRRHRDELVLVLQCYARGPRMIRRSVEKGLKKLGLDQAEILLLGWHDTIPDSAILDTVEKLREQGRFRFLGISSHQRPLFREYLKHGRYDVFHIRYNAAHPGAEQDIFPFLPEKESPGIVTFTNTRWGDLLKEKNMPQGISPLSASDCYRFALSNPHVHVAICGPATDEEMTSSLAVLRSGPLEAPELESARAIGEHVHGIRSIMNILT
jgi:aryl-alcohol dehydrogenase-like predicted oxidoreductase